MRLLRAGLADPLASIAATLRAVTVVAGIALLLWFLSDLTLLLFASVLIAVLLRTLADGLHAITGLPGRWSLAIVTVGLVVLAAGLAYWVGPRLIDEGGQLAGQISARIHDFRQDAGSQGLSHMLAKHLPGASGFGQSLFRPGLSLVRSTLGSLGSLLIVLVAAIYFAIAPAMYVNGLVRLVPIARRPRARSILLQIGASLRSWLLGQAIDMAVVGTLSGVGLELAGVPLALALAVLAGVFTFVPYVGSIAAAIPAVILAGTLGWSKVLWVLGVFLVCHAVEGYVIAPIVQRRTVELPPALTILALVMLGTAYGVLGLILGTPLIAAMLVVVREVYVADVLGDADP